MMLYIAGPMSRLPEFNYPAFHEAAARLREAGFQVVNPADGHDITKPLPAYDVMLAGALRKSLDCDAVAVLPGWEDSHGARLEVHVAEALGRPVRPVDAWLERAWQVTP